MIHSFLLIGQSNMAGRGLLNEAQGLKNHQGRLKVLRNGRWQHIYRPLNPDRRSAGSCLAESFMKQYAIDHPDVDVGVIPCADGGTCLEQWAESSLLFENAIYQTRLAMRTSHLVGILWHQGESDCDKERYPLYYEKITALMTALRREIGAEDVPILVGGLGDYLGKHPKAEHLANYIYVNEALKKFAADFPRTAYIAAEGLTSNPDMIHFNHKSLMEFGIRYYEGFKQVENHNLGIDDTGKEKDDKRNKLEEL